MNTKNTDSEARESEGIIGAENTDSEKLEKVRESLGQRACVKYRQMLAKPTEY